MCLGAVYIVYTLNKLAQVNFSGTWENVCAL